MESKATAKFVRVSPRKTRLVARNVADALDQPLPGAQGEEGDPAQIPQGVHHPVQGDGPVIPAHHRRVEFRCQNFHANHTFLQKKNKKIPKPVFQLRDGINSAVPPKIAPSCATDATRNP